MRMRTMMTIWLVALLLAGGVLLSACSGGTSSPVPEATEAAPAPANAEVPAIDAAALLEARCVDCHSLSKATEARHTQEQWQEIVTRMIGRGAVLNSEEEATLVEYLAETYKP